MLTRQWVSCSSQFLLLLQYSRQIVNGHCTLILRSAQGRPVRQKVRPRPSVRGAASRFLGQKAGTQPPHIAGPLGLRFPASH